MNVPTKTAVAASAVSAGKDLMQIVPSHCESIDSKSCLAAEGSNDDGVPGSPYLTLWGPESLAAPTSMSCKHSLRVGPSIHCDAAHTVQRLTKACVDQVSCESLAECNCVAETTNGQAGSLQSQHVQHSGMTELSGVGTHHTKSFEGACKVALDVGG